METRCKDPTCKNGHVESQKGVNRFLCAHNQVKDNYIQNMSNENFEYKNAMERLESILSRIDNSEMGIDELAGQVQEATELLRKCRQILLKTEQNVQEALANLDSEVDG